MSDETRDSVSDQESFVALMAVAIDDEALRRRLLGLLEMEPFHRRSALHTFIERMRLTGAPTELVTAVACLTDDAIAARAREVLQEVEAGHTPSLWYSL